MNGSMNLCGASTFFLWQGRLPGLQRLHLAFGGHLYFIGGHGGQLDLPPHALVVSRAIGLARGSERLGLNLGPGIMESEAALYGYFERGHGSRFPKYLGCLHFLQHDTAAIKMNSCSTRSRIFVIL